MIMSQIGTIDSMSHNMSEWKEDRGRFQFWCRRLWHAAEAEYRNVIDRRQSRGLAFHRRWRITNAKTEALNA